MAKRDYYEVLGVARDADEKDIKSAYRKLAVKYHPDRNPDDPDAEQHFKEAAEAYAVLSDSQKRVRYDRFGHQEGAGPGNFDPSVFSDFSDILGDIFGFGDAFGGRGRRGRGGAMRGSDLRYDLSLSFEEAAFGTEPKLRIPRLEVCEQCDGSGSNSSAPPQSCATCGGHGQVRMTQGFFTVARTCPECQGQGTVITDPCGECRGQGRVEVTRSIQVKVPGGVDTGARLRLQGEGEHGVKGGPPGDLFVVIFVEDDERWVRDGADVLSVQQIGYAQAALGATLEIETVHGPEEIEVPPGTSVGSRIMLHGKGVPELGRGRYGDHIVEIGIKVPHPRDLTDEQAELLRKLAESEGQQVREKKVLDRVKDLFG